MSSKSKHWDRIIANNNQIAPSLQIVFVDIVKYSARSVVSQRIVIERFMACLKPALNDLPLLSDEVGDLIRGNPDFYANVIKLPTGDGAALAFPVEAVADLHLHFAKRLLEEVDKRNRETYCPAFEREQWCNCHESFNLRVGVSAGGDNIIYKDINDNYNVAGVVINLAARVMDLADGGQIIFTRNAYEKLKRLKPALEPRFRELEHMRIKSEFISAYQYVGQDEPYINRRPPTEVYLRGLPTKADLDAALQDVRRHTDAGLGGILSHTDAGFESVRRALSTALSEQSFNDKESIYETMISVLKEARSGIKIVRLGSRAAGPDVIRAIADRVNDDIEYEIVIVLDRND